MNYIIKTKKHGLKFEVRHKRDETIAIEVAEKQVYRKPRLGFEPRKGETWLDLGGNIGAFAVWASKIYQCEVIVVEPCLENVELIRENLKHNGVHAKVLRGYATDSSNGNTEVFFNAKTPGRSGSQSKGQKEQVQNLSVNELLREYRPHGLKMDIEGGEFSVLDNGLHADCLNSLSKVAMEYHYRFEKSCKKARQRVQPFLDHFRHRSVSKSLFTDDDWGGWQDDLMYFWGRR